MKFSKKLFWTGGILGILPIVLSDLLGVPDGNWLLVNPIGIVLMIASLYVDTYEKNKEAESLEFQLWDELIDELSNIPLSPEARTLLNQVTPDGYSLKEES